MKARTPLRSRVWPGIRPMLDPARLQLAVKAAVTATGAWWIGHLLPDDLPDYAYYAPLGVLVAMMPTVAVSLSTSLKTFVGILLGLLIAWALILLGIGGALALLLALGLSVLVAGIPWIEAGGAYTPMAAAFVFLVGNEQPDEFSIGFAVQFALGAVLGVAVNVVIPPPLNIRSARKAVIDLRDHVARCVELLAESMEDAANQETASSWARLLAQARDHADEADQALVLARTSRRGNARVLLARDRLDDLGSMLAALRRIIGQLDEISKSFFDEPPGGRDSGDGEEPSGIPGHLWAKAGEVGQEAAALLRSSGVGENPVGEDELNRVLGRLSEAHDYVSEWPAPSLRDRERIYVFFYALRSILDELGEESRGDQPSERRQS